MAILGVPLLLIIKQPDYGTAITFIIATIFIGINLYVKISTNKQIVKKTDYTKLSNNNQYSYPHFNSLL